MATTVPRHGNPGPDDEGYAQDLGEGLAKTILRLERSSRWFGGALDKAVLHVQARLAVDPSASEIETWEAVVSAMQVGSAVFASASAPEGTVQCRINHEMRTLPATGPQPYADAGNWLTALWFAIVCRDQKRMTQLCELSLDLLRASGAEYDEYIYHWVDSLQTYWLERPGLVDKLVAAIENSDPSVARIATREQLNKILYQPINLFRCFLRKDHTAFNDALQEALELHKSYWTANEEREESPAGYLALGPLAITCLAYDAGFPIEVESDYLPKHLLQRDWLGEFPT
ncbi:MULTISPECIES: immunity 49 family protein [Streptomyces violaceusniger group]|uniref:immunity 49 family protein n=1 Tax=Streptomyces violaceusniger group TaxID=2839105 RepID=UPI000A394D2B|nr:immunity 49 family protein [Streptomyces rhizosphaericus]